MKTRILTRDELGETLRRLESQAADIEDTYEYPLVDLIEYLKGKGRRQRHYLEMGDNGAVCALCLHFSSPSQTWKMECGVEGIYRIDPRTLRAMEFRFTSLS